MTRLGDSIHRSLDRLSATKHAELDEAMRMVLADQLELEEIAPAIATLKRLAISAVYEQSTPEEAALEGVAVLLTQVLLSGLLRGRAEGQAEGDEKGFARGAAWGFDHGHVDGLAEGLQRGREFATARFGALERRLTR